MDSSRQKISNETVARTVILVLALVNQFLAVTGHPVITLENEDIYQLVSVLCTIFASITAWWKNNSFTCLACEADCWRRQQEKQRSEHSSDTK